MLTRTIVPILALAVIALFASCSTGGSESDNSADLVAVPTHSNDMPVNVPASVNELPSLDDYDVVIQDEDGWYLFANQTSGDNGYSRYSGIVWFQTWNGEQSFPAVAFYNHIDEVCTWVSDFNGQFPPYEGVCYSMTFVESTTMHGNWMWTHNPSGWLLNATLIHGTMGSHSAGTNPESWEPQPGRHSDRFRTQQE